MAQPRRGPVLRKASCAGSELQSENERECPGLRAGAHPANDHLFPRAVVELLLGDGSGGEHPALGPGKALRRH